MRIDNIYENIGIKKEDAYNFIVFKKVIRKKTDKETNEETEYDADINLGYYGTLQDGLKGVIKHSLDYGPDITELENIITKMDDIYLQVENLVKDLKKDSL